MSDDQIIKIAYGEISKAANAFQRSRASAVLFTDAVWRIRDAIQAADLWVSQEIDAQMLARRGGYRVNAIRQIYFFHPRYIARIIQADPAALIEVPLKMSVIELPGGTVDVRWTDPAAAFARYGSAQLMELGRELAAACEEITAASLRRNGT